MIFNFLLALLLAPLVSAGDNWDDFTNNLATDLVSWHVLVMVLNRDNNNPFSKGAIDYPLRRTPYETIPVRVDQPPGQCHLRPLPTRSLNCSRLCHPSLW